MVDQNLLNYMNSGIARGVSQEHLVQTLLETGWQKPQIDQALAVLALPKQSHPPTKIFSESDFPITKLWMFKIAIVQAFSTIFFLILGIFSFQYILIAGYVIVLVVPLSIFSNWLTRKYFHYKTEDDFLFIKQGILSKKQFHLPYAVVQHTIIKQDLFDRVFGLASLQIENAVQNSEAYHLSRGEWASKSYSIGQEFVGSAGGKISIPGLKIADAESLKDVILQKVKEHPLNDSSSGL
ncbi:PH domain-containing protein [Candidatus Woesebacteria bacterium]|nr:PH domain-containing protein [Candidatus Woesebacteria bacterium]